MILLQLPYQFTPYVYQVMRQWPSKALWLLHFHVYHNMAWTRWKLPDKNVDLSLTQIMPKTLDCESDVCVWQYVKAISLATSLCDALQLIKKWHPNKGKVCLCLWSLMKQDGSKPLSCHVQWQRGRYRITLLLMKQGRKCSSLMNNILAVIGNQSTTMGCHQRGT